MRTCEGCKYWSELIAEVRDGVVKAMCLHPDLPNVFVYVACHKYEPGTPVDIEEMEKSRESQ